MKKAASSNQLSHAVIEIVADAEGVDPLELEPSLYEVVDPDALDSLFAPIDAASRPNGQIRFEYCGHTVVVTNDGVVRLADQVASPKQFV